MYKRAVHAFNLMIDIVRNFNKDLILILFLKIPRHLVGAKFGNNSECVILSLV